MTVHLRDTIIQEICLLNPKMQTCQLDTPTILWGQLQSMCWITIEYFEGRHMMTVTGLVSEESIKHEQVIQVKQLKSRCLIPFTTNLLI